MFGNFADYWLLARCYKHTQGTAAHTRYTPLPMICIRTQQKPQCNRVVAGEMRIEPVVQAAAYQRALRRLPSFNRGVREGKRYVLTNSVAALVSLLVLGVRLLVAKPLGGLLGERN